MPYTQIIDKPCSYTMRIADADDRTLYVHPFSEGFKEIDRLYSKLVTKDSHVRTYHLFPRVMEILKIKNIALRLLVAFPAILMDIISMPFQYKSRKDNLRNIVPICKFLKGKISDKYLNSDSYKITFSTTEKLLGVNFQDNDAFESMSFEDVTREEICSGKMLVKTATKVIDVFEGRKKATYSSKAIDDKFFIQRFCI